MTTGNRVRDGRTYVSTSWGTMRPGFKETRQWTGADSVLQNKRKYTKVFYKVKVRRYRKIRIGKARIWQSYYKEIPRYYRSPSPKPKDTKLAPHNYSCSITKSWDYIGSVSDSSGNKGQCTTFWWTAPPGVTSWPSEIPYKLEGRLRNKIIGSDFNLGVFIAEGSEAMRMIFDAASRIDRSLRFLKKGRPLDAAKQLVHGPVHAAGVPSGKKSLASQWLQLQYGWLPLVHDLETGAQMLAHMCSQPFQRTVKVRYKDKDLKQATAFPYKWRKFDAMQQFQLIADIREVDVIQLIGLTDVASIVWERLPYSFVADWAIPIGNFLQARGLAQALKATYVKTVTRRVVATNFGLDPSYQQPVQDRTNVSALGQAYYQSVTVDRVVSTNLAIPLPQVKPLGDILNWKRAANAVALLVNNHSSKPTRQL